MSERDNFEKDIEICISMLKNRPVYKRMIQEGIFTKEQLDLCIKKLYENDLKEDGM